MQINFLPFIFTTEFFLKMWEKEFFQVYKIFTFILSLELSKRTLTVLTQSHITWGWVGESDKATQLLIAWKLVLNALSGDGGDFKTSLLLWKGSDKMGFMLEGHSEWPDWELRRAGSFQTIWQCLRRFWELFQPRSSWAEHFIQLAGQLSYTVVTFQLTELCPASEANFLILNLLSQYCDSANV